MLAKFSLTYANLGRNYLSGSNTFTFFNKEKSHKHKGELCMNMVTGWNYLLKEMSSCGNSRAMETGRRADSVPGSGLLFLENSGKVSPAFSPISAL